MISKQGAAWASEFILLNFFKTLDVGADFSHIFVIVLNEDS